MSKVLSKTEVRQKIMAVKSGEELYEMFEENDW
jgi:mannitol/fructose-specific phosphotransferase system IIA component (Ntr-type)